MIFVSWIGLWWCCSWMLARDAIAPCNPRGEPYGYRPERTPLALCLDHHLPLPLSAAHHWTGALHRDVEDYGAPHRTGALRPGGAFLDEHLRHQLCHGGGHRHPDGVPVRHQLGGVRAGSGWGHRANPGHGRRLLVLPGVYLPGTLALRGAAPWPPRALGGERAPRPRHLAVGLLHRGDECLDAASSRVSHGSGRTHSPYQLLGPVHESMAVVAVPPHDTRGCSDRLCRHGVSRRLLPARAAARSLRPHLRPPGR